MFLLLATVIALGFAAVLTAGAGVVRPDAASRTSCVAGEASTAVRALFAAVLGSVTDRQGFALVAALARPAPGVTPQHLLRREHHGPPPSGCPGCARPVALCLPPPGRR
jgi:hypothetical protein